MTRPRVFWPCAIISVAAFGLFGGIAMQINSENGLTQYDSQLAQELREHAKESPALRAASTTLSFIGSEWVLVPIGVAVAALLVVRRQHATALVWVLALGIGPFLNKAIKHGFQRLRPFAPADSVDWSFPSGHSMNSFIYYGLFTYALLVVIPRRWVKFTTVLLLFCLVILIGFSRMYLTRHFLSDVLGGFAFGAGWIAAWIAVLEYVRHPPAPRGDRRESMALAEVEDQA